MLPYRKTLIPFAKKLRKEMTIQERKLWYKYLNNAPVRFQRQKTIGGYILDFYAASIKLGIEIDGSQHETNEACVYDAIRSDELSSLGIEIIRFSNKEVDNTFNRVRSEIEQKIAVLLIRGKPEYHETQA